jgi:hypothetical protein
MALTAWLNVIGGHENAAGTLMSECEHLIAHWLQLIILWSVKKGEHAKTNLRETTTLNWPVFRQCTKQVFKRTTR